MFRFTATVLRAAAIAIPALLSTAIAAPAAAQIGVSVSFNDFHSRLAPYGTWSNNPRWGEVWHPTRVANGFRPYYDGHWEDTREYGWLWVSDESWGDVPYHYGRWVSDPREGWLWVPGYVWGPSWVVWRSGGGNIGWFPMPPDDNYYGDGAYRGNYDNEYGYRDWYGPSFSNDQFLSLWIFVGEDHFRDRNFRNYAVPQRNFRGFIGQTRDTTNYTTVNNYVVNRSVDSTRLQSDTKQRFQPVAASSVIGRNALVTQATVGRQVEQRERQQRPIPVNITPAEQRGRGNVNSNTPQQSPNPAAQGPSGQGENRGRNANGPAQPNVQTAPRAAVTVAPAANANPAPQGAAGRGNRGPAEAAPPAKPEANDNRQTNPQRERGAQPAEPTQTRAATQQNGKALVQDAPAPARVQGNARGAGNGAERPGNANANPARGGKQDDPKNTDEQKRPDDNKKPGAGRGQN